METGRQKDDFAGKPENLTWINPVVDIPSRKIPSYVAHSLPPYRGCPSWSRGTAVKKKGLKFFLVADQNFVSMTFP
jgi:hypothetical protein